MGVATIGRGLARDVGLPVIAYYSLHLAGASDWLALVAGMVVAGLRIVFVALRTRTPNPFAMVILLSFGMGLVLALLTGEVRFLLLKDSMTTAAVGLMFLVLAVFGHMDRLVPEACSGITCRDSVGHLRCRNSPSELVPKKSADRRAWPSSRERRGGGPGPPPRHFERLLPSLR